MFRVKKSNHSKKIVKQLKKEYKEDLEKSGVKHEIKSGGMLYTTVHVIHVCPLCCHISNISTRLL